MRRKTLLLTVSAALAAVLAAPAGARPAVAYAFTVVAPRSISPSRLVARAVIEAAGARCPPVLARTVRGRPLRVRTVRIPVPEGSVGFGDVTVCRAPLPRGLASARIGSRRLPLLPAGTPRRIAVLGDTGCRIETFPPTPPATEPSYDIQDCNSPAAWPLETVAEEVARAKPDVVVDTGDYFYRESDCPPAGPEHSLCAGSPPVNPPGSPNEDTWAGWRADWFQPARALFSAAPLVLARGNHETCERAGTGWFYLLDPGVSPADACQRTYAAAYDPGSPPPTVAQPPWVARLGSIDLVVFDSSSANDQKVENAEVYVALGRRAVRLLRPKATGWLLTHRPVYGWERFGGPGTPPVWTNVTLEAALDPLIGPFAAVFSGHLHLFETVQLPGRPAQLVLGDGGTALDASDQGGALPTFGPAPTAGQPPLAAPSRGVISFTFGWMLLRPATGRGAFAGTRYEAGRGLWGRCQLGHHAIDCKPRRGAG